jgi:pyridoxal phosphate enzyme (YggS family)
MIGHIQSRKTRDIAPLFDWVHSVDRYKIARRLDMAAADLGRMLPSLIEVNVSGEESKYGFDLSAWPDDTGQIERFFEQVERMLELPALDLRGLMTMAPYTEEPETVRPIFRRLRELREALCERFPEREWPHLSMGMSADYEVAVEEGATIVRIGTALFGPREY